MRFPPRRDWEVVAVDNFTTGRRENVAHLADDTGFTLVTHDVVDDIPVNGPVDAVLHMASPASPSEYLARPIETLEVGSVGTRRALDLARAHGARFLLASTSEIYGDPLVHPQPESYYGNVNSVGPRSVYDEAKRYAEAITMAYHREFGVDTKIVRIFNTYGPRLAPADGRVVSNFLAQAMRGDAAHDLRRWQADAFVLLRRATRWPVCSRCSSPTTSGPMNIGNPDEFTMLELAELVLEVTGAEVDVVFEPLPVDDPKQRRPDISLAREVLGWHPAVDLREGLALTHDWYRRNGDIT